MARLLFTRRPLVGSSIIREVTWSAWSHVEVFADETTLIGAEMLVGVATETLAARMALASRAAIMTIPTTDDVAVVAFARAQLGKGYDYLGALGLALHRDWRSADRWWCSGLATFALQAGGTKLFRDDSINRITPQDIWQMPFPVEVLK